MKNHNNILGAKPFIELIQLFKEDESRGYPNFEFYLGEKKEKYSWKDEVGHQADSLYLYHLAFSPVFWECFQAKKNLEAADFFGPTYFDKKEDLLHIKDLLDKKLSILLKTDSLEKFVKIITKTFFNPFGQEYDENLFISELEYEEGENWKQKWEFILAKLIEVNKGLIELVDEAIKKDKVLWILGI